MGHNLIMGCGASSQTPTDAAPTAASTRRRTPKLAIIVHRHGARFPTKPFPGDLSWPAAGQIWDKYEAQLTPTGSLQHVELGRKVRKRYDALFADLDPKQINDVVRSYTSNKQRTLFSAWSFLNGMFPRTPTSCFIKSNHQIAMKRRKSSRRKRCSNILG